MKAPFLILAVLSVLLISGCANQQFESTINKASENLLKLSEYFAEYESGVLTKFSNPELVQVPQQTVVMRGATAFKGNKYKLFLDLSGLANKLSPPIQALYVFIDGNKSTLCTKQTTTSCVEYTQDDINTLASANPLFSPTIIMRRDTKADLQRLKTFYDRGAIRPVAVEKKQAIGRECDKISYYFDMSKLSVEEIMQLSGGPQMFQSLPIDRQTLLQSIDILRRIFTNLRGELCLDTEFGLSLESLSSISIDATQLLKEASTITNKPVDTQNMPSMRISMEQKSEIKRLNFDAPISEFDLPDNAEILQLNEFISLNKLALVPKPAGISES